MSSTTPRKSSSELEYRDMINKRKNNYDRTADIRSAAQRRNSVSGTEKARMESTSGREASGNKMRAQRERTPGSELERLNNRRAARTKSGDFKGKYYGPDQFKGNMSILKAWRKAGSPDVNKFIRSGRGG